MAKSLTQKTKYGPVPLVLGIAIQLALPHKMRAELPQGFEVIDAVSGDNFFHYPRINSCGEFVFYVGFPADFDSEIYIVDNGRSERVTDNDVADSYADINDHGTIVWMRKFNGASGGEIWRWTATAGAQMVGLGHSPSINNRGEIVWDRSISPSCAYESDIYFWDGINTIGVSGFNGRSNQIAKVNDLGEVVWTSYDFSSCVFGDWTSVIQSYDDGTITTFPSMQMTPQLSDINNLGQVVWANFDYVEMWDGESTQVLTEGHIPSINDHGDVAFQRWEPYWVAWVYFEGEYYRIGEEVPPIEAARLDINNDGEVVWNWSYNSLSPLTGGIRYMRRIRNGDFDLNRNIDAADASIMTDCLTGPGDFDRLCTCRFSDIGHDRDVDLADFALFQNTYANPQYPGHECCNDTHGAGCNDIDVAECVCATLPTCCTDDWSASCVALVELLNCGECP